MKSIAALQVGETAELWEKVKTKITSAASLHEAMQAVTKNLRDEYAESLALVRVFVTVPYSSLPQDNQSFVSNLLRKQGVTDPVAPDTPVLSLMGTSGQEPEWNSIESSEGHVGIPLISDQFVAEIPMVSRLLTDLGLELDLGVEPGTTYSDDPQSNVRTFYVNDALSATDSRGRKIIVNQEFANQYAIKTVFGGGGLYPNMPQHVLAVIFFNKEFVSLDIATAFEPFISSVQASTSKFLEEEGLIF